MDNFDEKIEVNILDEDSKDAEKIKKEYSGAEKIIALVMTIMGYLAIRWFVPFSFGIAASIYNLALFVMAVIFLKKSNVKLQMRYTLIMAAFLIFNLVPLISSNNVISFLAIVFSALSLFYWLYLNSTGEEMFGEFFVSDIMRSLFKMPFSGFSDAPRAISANGKNKNLSKNILYVFIGLFFTVPITALVASLLFNADEAFSNLFEDLFGNFFHDAFVFALKYAIGLPIAFYLFGMLYSVLHKPEYSVQRQKVSIGIMPAAAMYAFITPVCILYVLFFVSQLSYFTSAFSNVLPHEYTYAEYARRGFFELCAISVINFGLLIFMKTFCKKTDSQQPKGLRFYMVMLSVFTILLISTALSKMVMYISEYGLTLLRVYTSWFMILLGVVFIFIILEQFSKGFKFYKAFGAAFIVMFGILCFSDVDAVIAKYNIEGYKSGRLEEMDVNAMYKLSDSAVYYVESLADGDDEIAEDARDYLEYKYHEVKNDKWENFNISTQRAKKVLRDYE